MRKKTYQERVDDYLKAEYGRTFSVSDTNQYCPEFKALPLLDQVNIIKSVWTINFDDEIERQATTIPKKIAVLIWKLLGRTGYINIEFWVESIFMFVGFLVLIFIVSLVLLLFMSCLSYTYHAIISNFI